MKKILIHVFILTLMVFPFVVSAAVGNIGFENPLNKANDINSLIKVVIDFIIKIASVIVVLFIIYAGFLFVSAQGKEDKIKQAKDTFFWAIIGALLILGANVLAEVVCSTAKGLGSVGC